MQVKTAPQARPDAGLKRCAIYARISPTPESEVGGNYSIASQVRENLACARTRGYQTDPALEFIDDNYSGTTLDRPALDRLRDLVRARAIDVVLVYSLDRLVRGLGLQMVLIDECKRSGVALEFVRDHYADSPEGMVMLQVQGAFNEYERTKFRERSARGRKEKALQGFLSQGSAPFGYRYLGKKQGSRGTLVIHEAEAAIVRQVFAWAASGWTMYRIQAELNRLGIKSAKGGLWSRTTVYQLLRNETYAGRAILGKRTERALAIQVPAIVDAVIFARVAAQLKFNREQYSGRPSDTYLLTGLMACALCKKRCQANHNTYRCWNLDNLTHKRRCPASCVRKEPIEDVVKEALWEALTSPNLLLKLVAAYSRAEGQGTGEPKRTRRLAREVERLKKDEARAARCLRNGDFDYDESRRALMAVRAQLRAAQAELTEAEGQAGVVRQLPERARIVAWVEEIRAAGKPVTFEEWRKLLKRAIRVIRYHDGAVDIECSVTLEVKTAQKPNNTGVENCYSVVSAKDSSLSLNFVISKRVA
jgi:site-specific DNA recombinase